MKKVFSFLAIGAVAIGASSFIIKEDDDFKVDTEKSKIDWVGGKDANSHPGYFKLTKGEVEVKDNKLVDGEFTIDLKSVTITDGAGEKFAGHLKNADILDTEKYPTAEFEIKEVTYTDATNCTITGELDLHGTEVKVSFPATTSVNGNTFSGKGSVTIDRTLWNILYGVKGEESKKVKVDISIEASK